jgi:hypothetical protein
VEVKWLLANWMAIHSSEDFIFGMSHPAFSLIIYLSERPSAPPPPSLNSCRMTVIFVSYLGANNTAYLCDGLDPGRPVRDGCRSIEKSSTKYLNKSSS